MDQGMVDAITGLRNQLAEFNTPLRRRSSGKAALESARECVSNAMVLLRDRKKQVARLKTIWNALSVEIDEANR